MTLLALPVDALPEPTEVSVRTQVTVPLRFPDGYATTADVFTFVGLVDGKEHLLLGLGDWRRAVERSAAGGDAPLVRPHSECLTGDVFGSERCDCGPQLREAAERITDEGGFLLYLRQEGRGIGLGNKIKAYALQAEGLDTYEANRKLGFPDDLRSYDIAAEMLRQLGVRSVDLITNNPLKIAGLVEEGNPVRRRIPSRTEHNPHNVDYLRTKRERTGHLIELFPEEDTEASVG